MDTTIIKEIEQKASKPVIDSITFYDKDNYVNFSDTDSSTDYFNSYSIGTSHLIDWINEGRLGAIVKVSFVNNEDLSKYHKRLARIQKAAGYNLKVVEKKGIYRISENSKMCYIQPYKHNDYYLYDAGLISPGRIITN